MTEVKIKKDEGRGKWGRLREVRDGKILMLLCPLRMKREHNGAHSPTERVENTTYSSLTSV